MNPENAPVPTNAQGTAVTAAAVHAAQELRLAYENAIANPRREEVAADALQGACRRLTLADAAEYEYPRGKKKNEETGEWETNMVRGTSVYLAREAARIWGHLQAGFVILEDSGDQRHLRATARDLQTGASFTQDALFPKLIQRKEKVGWDSERRRPIYRTTWIPAEPRELLELTNKEGAKAVRNCLLQILPDWYVEEALEVARATLAAASRKAVDEARYEERPHGRLLDAFDEYRVSAAMIVEAMGVEIAELGPDQVATLRRYYRAIREGQASVGDYFNVEPERAAEEKPKPKTIDDALDVAAGPEAETEEPDAGGSASDVLDSFFEQE